MTKPFSLAELSKLTKADLIGDPELLISSVDNLESASEKDASFLANPKYNEAMKQSNAGVICIDRKTDPIQGKNFLVSDNPSGAFQLIAEAVLVSTPQKSAFTGIHPTAVVHETAKIAEGTTIGPHAVVDAHASIGKGTELYPHVYVGVRASIGVGFPINPQERLRVKGDGTKKYKRNEDIKHFFISMGGQF